MAWLPRLVRTRTTATPAPTTAAATTPPRGDEDAMRALQVTGDHAAFARLVDRWQPAIRRLCVRMTGDEHRGEDLAQEVFTRVYMHRARFDAARRFSTWLWRIALNLCHEELRRATRRGERGGEAMEAAGDGARDRRPTPAEELDQRERVGLVRRALADLPEMYRVVVVLRQYENLKFREIAEVLDLPEGTVKWRMAAALAHLRRALRPIDDEPGHTRDTTDADVENTTDAKDTKDTKSAGPAGDEGGGAAQPAKQGAKKERLLL